MQAENKFINGRQITFLVHQNYAKADEDVQILEFHDLLAVKLHSDNLVDFLHRWDKILFAIRKRPSDDILLSLLTDELTKCGHLKATLDMIKLQDTQYGVKMDYERLLTIARTHVETRRKEKLRSEAYSGIKDGKGARATPAAKRQQGDCNQWMKSGRCVRDRECAYAHDEAKQGIFKKRGKSPSSSPSRSKGGGKGKGKGKGKSGKGKSKSPGGGKGKSPRSQSPRNSKSPRSSPRAKSPKGGGKGRGKSRGKSGSPKSSPRGLTPQRKQFRGRSPSGERNRPVCHAFMKNGWCPKGRKCHEVHLRLCTFHKKPGGCRTGSRCPYRHCRSRSNSPKSPKGSPRNGKKGSAYVAVLDSSPLNQ